MITAISFSVSDASRIGYSSTRTVLAAIRTFEYEELAA